MRKSDGAKPVTILLMGAPNVGKSVLFNYFTGMDVSCANYAGTTVEYAAGIFRDIEKPAVLIDVPGTYSLEASNEAEQIAVDMLTNPHATSAIVTGHCGPTSPSIDFEKPSAVICVLDAVNLESSLYLLSSILDFKIPVIAALNRIDVAESKHISIDHQMLADTLGIPVIPTIAPSGFGTEEIKNQVLRILSSPQQNSSAVPEIHQKSNRWEKAETLARKVQTEDRQESSELSWVRHLVRPWPGLAIALGVIIISFSAIVGAGMALRQFLLLPVLRGFLFPVIIQAVQSLTLPEMIQNILIGEYGFLIKGIEWPFALVFPYMISFYTVMALLEDSGYLPRLGALLDGVFNRLGLSGSSIIPLLLGYGCAIPAIMATRSLSTHKERIITVSIICLTIPCISQTGAIITLLAEYSALTAVGLIICSALLACAAGIVLDSIISGPVPAMVLELPELLVPKPAILGKKILIRIKRYISDGAIPMIGAVGLASILYETGIMAAAGRALSPLVTGWLRLPEEAAVPLILGIMRRELSILPLLDMELTQLQLFTGSLVGLFYVPCIAVIVTVAREFRILTAAGILIGTTAAAFIAGGIAAHIGLLF